MTESAHDKTGTDSRATDSHPTDNHPTDNHPTASDALQDADLRANLAKVERKPPAYRAFRVTLYSLYLLLALWLIGGITIGVWESVYGGVGSELQAREQVAPAVGAAPAKE